MHITDWPATVTAVGTLTLAVFTIVLAVYTRQLAQVTRRASVILTLEPNRHSARHFDLRVTNDGSSAAHDIRIELTPDMPPSEGRSGLERPFQTVSILRVGQTITSYAAEYAAIREMVFTVQISWRDRPAGRIYRIAYPISFSEYLNATQLGTDPISKISQEIAKIREEVKGIADGRRRFSVEVYDKVDRTQEQQELENRFSKLSSGQEPS